MALFLTRGLLPSLSGRLCKAGPAGGQRRQQQMQGGLLLPVVAAAWRGLPGRQYSSSSGNIQCICPSATELGGEEDNTSIKHYLAVPGIQERTLIAVKPDGVQRRLIGDLISRFEKRGFKLVGMKLLQAPEGILADHYHDLRRKPFYPALIRYMSSGPVVAMVWEGYNVVRSSRAMVGETDSAEAKPGTIRGDFSVHISRNVIHASDSVEMAQKEISLWFRIDELVDWNLCDYSNLYQE